MKTRAIKVIVLIIGIILISSSCTIQKRRYLKGYYVSWNKNFNSKHQATKTNRLNVKKNIKKINLTTSPTGINMPKKIEIKPLKKIKTTSNQLKNKNVKKSSNNTLKNNINPHKREVKQQYTIDVATDSTTTDDEQTKNHIVPIKNEKASNALAIFMISILLFIFGGFLTIILAYFLAISAHIEISNNPELYKRGEKIKTLIVIILFVIFALLLSLLIGLIYGFFSYIFYAVAFVYGLSAIIGLIILRNKSLERKSQKKQNNTVDNNNSKQKTEQAKNKSTNKKSYKQLAIFLLISLLSFGLYFLIG